VKTILYLPKGTPTSILLKETGFYPIEYIIKKKQILHAKRIASMTNKPLIKEVTEKEGSSWRQQVDSLAEEFHVKEIMPVMSKGSLSKTLQIEIDTKFMVDIEKEAEAKTKIKHWREMRKEITETKRPQYMDKMNRKQCNAILRARSSMLQAKCNFKKSNEDIACRFCKKTEETQKHLIQKCPVIRKNVGHIPYENLFTEDVESLEKSANFIIKLEEYLKETNEHLDQHVLLCTE